MEDAKIPPFGRDFDEAMVKHMVDGGAAVKRGYAAFTPVIHPPVAQAAPLERLESALDELADTANMVIDMAQGLAGPHRIQPKPDLGSGAGKMRPDGLFNRMYCVAADISAQTARIREQVRRVNAGAAGIPEGKI